MIVVKYNKKTQDIKCLCGGDVMCDGEGGYEMFYGLGDLGEVSSKMSGFGISKIRYTGWIGQCEKCKKQVIAWKTKKLVHKKLAIV